MRKILIGCAHLSPKPTKPFVEPQYGMTKRALIDQLGNPESIEIYQKADQTKVEFYNYISRYESEETKVPICLINNKVVGWGKAFYQDHVSSDDVKIR